MERSLKENGRMTEKGQGAFTYPNGRKGVGEFRNDRPWNITDYDKHGNILGKYVNGVLQ
jgi:hypothetical protein